MTAPRRWCSWVDRAAGKGTQGARFSEHFGITHLSTGDALRRAVRERTPLGTEVAAAMAQGAGAR